MNSLSHALLMHASRLRGPRTRRIERDLIVAPTEFGSVGDLAMVEGLQNLLASTGRPPPLIASAVRGEGWHGAGTAHDPPTIPSRLSEVPGWFRAESSFSRVYLIGADVLDGAYSVRRSLQRLRFCALASTRGAKVTITGCSFRSDPQPSIMRALRSLPGSVRVCARDPGSRARLEKFLGRPVEAVADLAFLVQPDTEGATCRAAFERINAMRAARRRVVALCPNRVAVGIAGRDASRAERAAKCVDYFLLVAKALQRLESDVAFALIAHDSRGPFDDDTLCDMLAAQLGDAVGLRVRSSTRPSEIKAILGGCDALLTGRMHCGIAAIGSGTPAVFLDYQGKIEGLAALTDAARIVRVGDDSATPPDVCAGLLVEAMAPDAAWRTTAPAQLTRIETMAHGNAAP